MIRFVQLSDVHLPVCIGPCIFICFKAMDLVLVLMYGTYVCILIFQLISEYCIFLSSVRFVQHVVLVVSCILLDCHGQIKKKISSRDVLCRTHSVNLCHVSLLQCVFELNTLLTYVHSISHIPYITLQSYLSGV